MCQHSYTHAAEYQKLLPANAQSNVDIRIPRGAALGMQAVKKFGLSPAAAAAHIAALAQLTPSRQNHQVAGSAAADPTSAWGSTVLQAAEEELGKFIEQVGSLSIVGAASHAISARRVAEQPSVWSNCTSALRCHAHTPCSAKLSTLIICSVAPRPQKR